jgi:UDP-N-acetyl-D-glucosamine dehydrogenase
MQKLLNDLRARQAKIGIVGLGYVGLPLLIRFCEENFKVVGFDIDSRKVEMLNSGKSYIEHIPDTQLISAVKNGSKATTDFKEISNVDAIILCVPTPLNTFREPDLSFIFTTIDALCPYLKKGQIVSLESTTYPGTTEEELRPRIEAKNFKIGEDIFLVFSPEREDPGRKNFSTKTIPKVVGGSTPNCLEVGIALYEAVIDKVVPVSSTQAAEMTKLLENIHRAVNIGLVNEMKIVCHKMGIDIHEVIDAAATKPFGFVAYHPGPGIGGHCIPIDPFYLTWKAREYGIHTRFIELAGEINSSMPSYVIKQIVTGLNKLKKSVHGSKFLVLGIAYKKNVDDMRESPSVTIMEKLRDYGGEVEYHDPHVPTFPKMREHNFDLSSRALAPELLTSMDCIVIGTDHDAVDYELVKKHAKLLVDTRGRYRQDAPNIIRA